MKTKTSSLITKIGLSFFIGTLLLLLIFYQLLQTGVVIDSLHISSVHIKKLYLKLDKKLILTVDEISLPIKKERKKPFDFKKIEQNLFLINLIPKYFEKIDIKKLHFDHQSVQIAFKSHNFLIHTPMIDLVTSLQYRNKLYAKIKRVYYRPLNITIHGRAIIEKMDFVFKGQFAIEKASGTLTVQKRDNILSFFLQSAHFNNKTLQKIFSHIPINKEIEAWSCKKIVAKDYVLKYFKGKIDLSRPFDPTKLEAVAIAKDADIKFNPSLPPVYVQKIALHLKNNNLYFKLFSPTYQNKKLDGSKVTIYKLGQNGSYIDIYIHTRSRFDNTIKKILDQYNIHVPIEHKKGVLNAKIALKILFSNYDVDFKGDFTTKNSLINIKNLDIALLDAAFNIHNKQVIINPSEVSIPPFVKANVRGKIDLAKDYGKLDLMVHSLNIQTDKKRLLGVSNITETLLLDLKNSTVHLDRFNVDILFDQNKTIVLHNLAKLRPYSKILQQIPFDRGEATVTIAKNIDFHAKIESSQLPLWQHKKRVTRFFIDGSLKKRSLWLNINHSIDLTLTNSSIIGTIKDYTIDISDFKPDSQKSSIPQTILIRFENCALVYDRHRIPIEKAMLRYKKGAISLKGYYRNSHYKLFYKDNRIDAALNNLDENQIHSIVGLSFFSNGRYSIVAKGKIENLTGRLTINHAYIKDLKVVNNLFAFINSIPSLIMFQDPGFNQKGLYVQKGVVDFVYGHKMLFIKNIHLVSQSVTFDGHGIVNLSNNKIHLTLQLKTLKQLSGIVSKIPVAGYILLGEDGTVSTKIKIEGTLQKPKIKTQTIKDTFNAPINIIKRTLQLPFKLFE